jgi:hypothetical protein
LWCLGCFCVSDTAQVELKSGRVSPCSEAGQAARLYSQAIRDTEKERKLEARKVCACLRLATHMVWSAHGGERLLQRPLWHGPPELGGQTCLSPPT